MDNRRNTNYWEMYKNIKPSLSGNHREKIICEFSNLIKEMLLDFNKPIGNTSERWAKRLAYNDYTIAEVQDACFRVSETCRFIPSYAEFKSLLKRNCDPLKNENETEILNKDYIKEEERFQKIKSEIIRMFGDNGFLDAYFNRWLNKVFRENIEMLENQGLDRSMFLKTACFDLADVNYNPTRVSGHIDKWLIKYDQSNA